MALSTAEVFGWVFFLLIITILFFAAFGGSTVTEESIEEYIEQLMKDDKNNNRQVKLWLCENNVLFVAFIQYLRESQAFMQVQAIALKYGNVGNVLLYGLKNWGKESYWLNRQQPFFSLFFIFLFFQKKFFFSPLRIRSNRAVGVAQIMPVLSRSVASMPRF